MSASQLKWIDGRTVTFDNERSATLRGRLPRRHYSPPEDTDDVAIKTRELGGLTAAEKTRARSEMEAEVRRMQERRGRPPFLRLLAADTARPDGSTVDILCIAMPPLLDEVYVELSVLLGWTKKERQERLKYNLVAVVRDFLQGSNTREAWTKVLDAVKALRGRDHTLERHPSVNGTVMIDLAKAHAAPPSPRPYAHPAFLGPRAARIPLDTEAQEAPPEGTNWYMSPEHFVVMMGPDDEEDEDADQDAASTSGDPTTDAIFAGWQEQRKELRSEGMLTGRGKEEAVLVGEPSLSWGVGMSYLAALRGRPVFETIMAGLPVPPTGAEWQHVKLRREQQMALQWEEHMPKLIDGHTHHPLHHGHPTCPLAAFFATPGVEWTKSWVDLLGATAAGGLRTKQRERASLREMEERLFRGLELLESAAVRQAVESGIPYSCSAAASPALKRVQTEGDDSGAETGSGSPGGSPASYDALPDSPLTPQAVPAIPHTVAVTQAATSTATSREHQLNPFAKDFVPGGATAAPAMTQHQQHQQHWQHRQQTTTPSSPPPPSSSPQRHPEPPYVPAPGLENMVSCFTKVLVPAEMAPMAVVHDVVHNNIHGGWYWSEQPQRHDLWEWDAQEAMWAVRAADQDRWMRAKVGWAATCQAGRDLWHSIWGA
ncbi:unnamed protein product [Vitrella brassicaformis CCMP3155]|uniref:Uncharacterized protein n=1 Tax=Vitrella brassicaformis (strain CCMP3155) TaxID=1169540 RepID=A0A0G4FFP9_VITBC|nr:unnamed protein product [Vitrella brassicaformis CCMP3155]|eukprot:CEM11872.1 unnamed protein product [Vitrella brassicaformis CCMP3155]